MPQNYRHSQYPQRPRNESWAADQTADPGREGRYRAGNERDRYQAGGEQRYQPDPNRWHDSGYETPAFRGDRSYSSGGYQKETGYRTEGNEPRYGNRGPYNRFEARRDRGFQNQGNAYDEAYDQAERSFRGDLADDYESRSYYGTGNHAGAGEYSPVTRMRGSDFYAGSQPDRNYSPYYGREQGSHRGRGPKGYERSDERLREIICERLTDDPWIDASDVSIEVTNKVVRLTGVVNNRQTKYEIEELVERSANVREIDNQLRVQGQSYEETRSTATPSTPTGSLSGTQTASPSTRKN